MSTPAKSGLLSIWGTGPSEVFATDQSGNVVHYDGVRWSVMQVTNQRLDAIWAANSRDVYVGAHQTLFHYDGDSWTNVYYNDKASIYDIWGSSSTDVYVVGPASPTGKLVLRGHGNSWGTVDGDVPSYPTAVWGTGPTDVFMAGGKTISHYDGVQWKFQYQGTDVDLHFWSIGGSGSIDVYAAADFGKLFHYDGTQWNNLGQIPGGSPATAIWVDSSRTLFGADGARGVLKFVGTKWQLLSASRTFSGIYAQDATHVWAVGERALIAHYDGRQWQLEESVTDKNLSDVWGKSVDEVFAVGDAGVIVRYDGTQWRAISSGINFDLRGVWGSGPADIFAVGANGGILHYDGARWARQTSNTSEWLSSVWGNSSTDVYAVGTKGTIIHYDGNSWSPMMSPTSEALYGVWGDAQRSVFAAGAGGTFLHYDGGGWTNITTGFELSFRDIRGFRDADLFLVASEGRILHSNGTTFGELAQPETAHPLMAAGGTIESGMFFAGSRGTVLRLACP